MSGFLTHAGREHLVVERRNSLGGGWQDRWDEFALVTPNWTSSFPGWAYDGPETDGFMGRHQIAARVARYAEIVNAPVALATDVRRLAPLGGGGFLATTSRGELSAQQVVVATGSYHAPRIPPMAKSISDRVTQLHSHDYRNEAALPEGAVLVVGSGQTGLQLAEESLRGRPARLHLGGIRGPRASALPRARFLRLDGRRHAPRRRARRDTADRRPASRRPAQVPRHARTHRAGRRPRAPPADDLAVLHEPADLTELDLLDAGVSTIIWATGYDLDYGWIDAPILDESGDPRNARGVAAVPGLYFLGLLWQHSVASASLVDPELDGPYLLDMMGRQAPRLARRQAALRTA
jgi:putative flavoprotein involved in K+ transport